MYLFIKQLFILYLKLYKMCLFIKHKKIQINLLKIAEKFSLLLHDKLKMGGEVKMLKEFQ